MYLENSHCRQIESEGHSNPGHGKWVNHTGIQWWLHRHLFPISFVVLQITVSLTTESERPRLGSCGLASYSQRFASSLCPLQSCRTTHKLHYGTESCHESYVWHVRSRKMFSVCTSKSKSNRRHSSETLLVYFRKTWNKSPTTLLNPSPPKQSCEVMGWLLYMDPVVISLWFYIVLSS